MQMPKPDQDVLARRQNIAMDLRRLLAGRDAVIDDEDGLRPFECDGLTLYRQLPMLAVLPETVQEVSAVLRYCYDNGVKIVPRGSGTSLSGGSLPLADGVLLGMGKFNRITEIDAANRCITTQPCVSNLAISQAVRHLGLYYAPDPSSQIICSIGGNVAENSGGVHSLKYGLTTNNLLGIEMVLMDGEVLRLGGKVMDGAGYDLLGVMTGSEGLLGVITEACLRLIPIPATAKALLVGFQTDVEAGHCVAAVIAAGIIPAGMEMMDKPALNAAEDFVHAGYPRDAGGLLIIELDGSADEVEQLASQVSDIARRCGANSIRTSQSEEERELFWSGRKAAFPAVGRISPDYICMDGSIPRKKLPEMLGRMQEMARREGLAVCNVFHAGDGNLHPLIMFDADEPGQIAAAERLGADILKLCVEMGGSLTGEHGVGVEKRDLMGEMFSEADLAEQQRIKCVFDGKQLLNPGKMFPTLHRCAELGTMRVHRGRMPFPDIPRF